MNLVDTDIQLHLLSDECHNVNLVSFICFHLQVSSTADLMFGGFQKKEFHRFCETSILMFMKRIPK